MAKNSLFRRSLFGYSKEDVNAYILEQNERVQQLTQALSALEERFESYRRFYETLLRVHDENLAVLREVQIRATQNEERVRILSEVFGVLSASYASLYELASEQQNALSTAKQYENKATKYDALALQMKELVLPESMRSAQAPLAPLPEVAALPAEDALSSLTERADSALREMLADARAFYMASARLQTPASVQENVQNVG